MYQEMKIHEILSRALNSYIGKLSRRQSKLIKERSDVNEILALLNKGEELKHISKLPTLCEALGSYIKGLNRIKEDMIAELGDLNPLLVNIEEEIDLSVQLKRVTCGAETLNTTHLQNFNHISNEID